MQLVRKGALLVPVLFICGAVDGSPLDEQNAEYLFRMFRDSDDIHVVSHIGSYDFLMKNNTRMNFHVNHERVSIPAVSAPPGSQEAVDAITTASRPIAGGGDAYSTFTKIRNEFSGDVSVDYASMGYYMSKESDYFAQQVRGGVNYDFFQENLNLSLGGSYGWDSIDPLDDEDTPGLQGSRNTTHGNIVATQTLTRGTVLRVGAEMSLVKGLQHSPYRNVYAGGGHEPELHPDRRVRRDVFVRINQYMTSRAAAKALYRYYTDDWGIKSHTLGGRLVQYVTPQIRAQYRYRYYTQDGAWFYAPEYAASEGVDGFRTGDYRMGAFTAHLFGAQLGLNFSQIPTSPMGRLELLLKYERYFNSNDFSANIFESSVTYRF